MCIFKDTINKRKRVNTQDMSENIFLNERYGGRMDINGLLFKSNLLYRKRLHLLRKKIIEKRDIPNSPAMYLNKNCFIIKSFTTLYTRHEHKQRYWLDFLLKDRKSC